MTDLLKGGGAKAFKMTEAARRAFARIKELFTQAPMLRHFNSQRLRRVETDASDFAVGLIMSQLFEDGWHPVVFWSRKLTEVEGRYKTHDKELLAIVEVFYKWRHYLAGEETSVEVLSDYNNLKYFITTKSLTAHQVR